jgi:hypothetical protein
MSNLYIVTVATHSEFYFPYLIKSCTRFGYNLVVLGFKEKWLGFNWRFKLMINFLNTLKNNDIVCFIDGYDVICNRDLNELRDEFIKFKNQNQDIKIIISHDKIINKFYEYLIKIKMNNYGTLINAGSYIGYVSDLLYVLNKIQIIDSNNDSDDQILLTQYYKNHKNDIYIDTETDFFVSLSYKLKNNDIFFEIKNNIAFYKNKQPFFIHGQGFTNLNKLIQNLGYDLSDNEALEILNKMKKESRKRTIKSIKVVIKKYYLVLIIVLIFIYYNFLKKYDMLK